jgi:hypothetical protein
MKRTAIIVLVLAALTAISAMGSPVRPAKPNKSAAAESTRKSHPRARHPSAHMAKPATRHKPGRTGAHKPSTAGSQAAAMPRTRVHKQAVANPCAALPATPSRPRPLAASKARPPETRREADLPRRTPVSLTLPLRGSYASLVRQNERTEADGLERIQDDQDLRNRIARKMLVRVPVSAALTVNASLPADRRYCRPWTARFLSELARAHAALFHRPLTVSSAVRTVEYQKRLMQINGNAAAAEGDIASPHLTGATIDIAKVGLSRKELAWMRGRLLALEGAGKLDVEEEFEQTCFHITVYKSYLPPARTNNLGQQKTGLSTAAQRKAQQPGSRETRQADPGAPVGTASQGQ